jgi:hypothetical protein
MRMCPACRSSKTRRCSALDETYEITYAMRHQLSIWRRCSMTTLTASKAGLKETLYLLSIHGMKESIRKGLKTPIQKCAKKLKW